MNRLPILAASALLVLPLAGGCQSDTATGAGAGALIGGIGGAIIGHQSGDTGEGAALGALVGGGVGGGIGAVSDYNKREQRQRHAYDAGYHDGRQYQHPNRQGYYEGRQSHGGYDGAPYYRRR